MGHGVLTMNAPNRTPRTTLAAALLLAAPMALVACAGGPSSDAPASPMARGARIWASTCNRCHNLRPPGQFAPEQWPVIVSHMRTRADLTREEAEAVAEYLRRVSKRTDGGQGPA